MLPARHLATRLASQAGAGTLTRRPHAPHIRPVASTSGRPGDAPLFDAGVSIRAAGTTATSSASPAALPRLTSDVDLLRSLTGVATDPLPRAFAPPAEPRICRCCAGTALTPCPTCSGSGSLPPGGYRATNPVLMPKIVGTTWTAAERTLGRTHFRCVDKRRATKLMGGGGIEGKADQQAPAPAPPPSPPLSAGSNAWFVLMVSACDPTIRLWVEARALKDRARWTPGWVTVADVASRRADDAERVAGRKKKGVGPRAGAGCKACGGSGRVACRLCSRAGELVEV